MKLGLVLVLLLSSLQAFAQLTNAAPRTVMVQLFEWPWTVVASECETVLGPQGYAAVQVSPPQEHVRLGQNNWWERYQPVSYKLESRSGTEAEFRDMIKRCRASGVDVYVDVILNHMAARHENGVGFAGTRYEKYSHPGLYSAADFHNCGRYNDNEIRNYKDRFEVQFCELVGLADLRTESEIVRDKLGAYMNQLLDMGAMGFRIDAAKHIPAEDIAAILSRLNRSVYIISETLIGGGEPVQYQEYTGFGDVNYFIYTYDLGNALYDGQLAQLPQIMSGYLDSKSVVVFSENHDIQRLAGARIPSYQKNPELHFLSQVFLLTWPYGYPQVFSGYSFQDYNEGPRVDAQGYTTGLFDARGGCQAPWSCEHRLAGMAELVQFHNATDGAFVATRVWRGTNSQLAFSRSRLGFAALNADASALVARIPTDLADGVYCNLLDPSYDRLSRRCTQKVLVQNGQVHAQIAPRSAMILLHNVRGSK